MTEKEFHKQRLAFAIINNEIHTSSAGLSHKEWLIGENLISENEFDDIIRGFIDETGIYFYQGDFEQNEDVQKAARKYGPILAPNSPIYCGMHKGEIGERWTPIIHLTMKE